MTATPDASDQCPQILKSDLFGQILLARQNHLGCTRTIIVRDLSSSRWWLRPVARALAAREARVLKRLPEHPALPTLISWDGHRLQRSFVAGQPMQTAKPTSAEYFRNARALLHILHRHGVVHNDTAKEPNWLVLPDGSAGLVDFQLARHFPRRSCVFKTLAREDIRHLLKHKRTYRADDLTKREKTILASPAAHTRLWRNTGKRVYLFVTRKILKWRDREGANDRHL